MDNWRNIWFEQIPDNLQAYLNLKEEKFNEMQLENLEYLILCHHKKISWATLWVFLKISSI